MERIGHCDSRYEDAVLNLGEYAFRYKLTETERKFRKERMKHEHVIGVFDGEILASKLHLLPQYLFLGGKSISFGGVAGVATWPEYRRKGHVRQLIQKSLEEMKTRKMGLSMLHPFDIDFYRRFGWELTQHARSAHISPRDIPYYQTEGYVSRVQYDDEQQAIQAIYERHAKQYGLMLNRNDYWWRNRVLSDDDIIVMSYNETGKEDGFLLANLSKDQLAVKELYYDSLEAFQRLLTWVRNHDSMVEKVKLVLAPNDPALFYLHNPRVKEDRHAYFMSRIVDVETFFTQYPFKNTEDVTINLDITDEVAKWNNGTWYVSIHDQTCTVSKEEAKKSDIQISSDINSLTALWLNAQRVEDLLFFKRLQVKGDIACLKSLIVKETPALLDFF